MKSKYLAGLNTDIDLISTSEGFRLRIGIGNDEESLNLEFPISQTDAKSFLAIAQEEEFSL
jgi:hypothetical protein